MRRKLISRFLIFVFCFLSCSQQAVLGIDLGGQRIKVGTVAHGKGVHIMLDGQSKRIIPSLIYFDDHQRLYGNEAVNAAAKKPERAITNFTPFLGYNGSYKMAFELWNHLSPSLTFKGSSRSKSTKESLFFAQTVNGRPREISPTESLAMFLRKIKSFNQVAHGYFLKDIAFAIPSYFTQSQRLAVIRAAELADLNVLALVGENIAAATNYALSFHQKSSKTILIYNMGHHKTELTVVRFEHSVNSKTNQTKKIATEMDYVYNESLGGRNFDVLLAEDLVKWFAEKNGFDAKSILSKEKVFGNLMTQCEKAKKTLSINKEARVFIEDFYNERDLVRTVRREDFENLTSQLVRKAGELVKELEIQNFSEVVPIGGATRIIALRERLGEISGRHLTKTLNADESAALGAAIRAANVSNAFRLNKVGLRERTPFNIDALLSDSPLSGQGPLTSVDVAKNTKSAMLFRSSDYTEITRTMSINSTKEIYGQVRYSSKAALPKGQERMIFQFKTKGMQSLTEKHGEKGVPKISITFELDKRGVISVQRAEALYQKGDKSLKNVEEKPKTESTNIMGKNSTEKEREIEKIANDTEKKALNQSKKNSTSTGKEEKKEKTSFILKVEYLNGFESDGSLFGAEEKESRKILDEYDQRDAATIQSAEKLNELEELFYNYREVVETRFYDESSTETEKGRIAKLLNETGEWLSENSGESNLNADKIDQKKKALQDGALNVMARMRERIELPKLIEGNREMLMEVSRIINDTIANKTWIPHDEINKFINETNAFSEWLQGKLNETQVLPKSSDLTVSTNEIKQRANIIMDRAKEFHLREKIEEPKFNNDTNTNKTSARKRRRRKRKRKGKNKTSSSVFGDILKKTKNMFGKDKNGKEESEEKRKNRTKSEL